MSGSASTPTIDAWKAAVFHVDTRGRGRSAAANDTTTLVKCLVRAAAFSASSSGCEHTFSVTQWAHEGRRGFISCELEEDELKLMCDRNGDDDELVALARRIWADAGYGTPRASGPNTRATRVDKGIKRKHEPSADSEIGFLKRRRDAVSAMKSASSSSSSSRPVASSSVSMAAAAPLALTSSHEKELDHLREKEFDRLVDAVLNGSVQGERLPTDMLELVVREIRRRSRTATGPRVRKLREKPAALRGAAFFFEPGVVDDDVRRAMCAHWRSAPVERHAATYFVVPDPTALPQRSAWACGLLGSWACDVEYVASGGSCGIAIGHRRFGGSRRFVYLSAGFRALFGEIVDLISRCAPTWRVVADDMLAAVAQRAQGARAAELFALVTSAEKNAGAGALPLPLVRHKYVLTEVMARKLVVEIAPLRSIDGLQRALHTNT